MMTTMPTTTDKMTISRELKLIDSLSSPEAPALFPSFGLDMLIYALEIPKMRHNQNMSAAGRMHTPSVLEAVNLSEEGPLKVNIVHSVVPKRQRRIRIRRNLSVA